MIVHKTSVFPARREIVFEKLQRLETLQTVAAPYASFTPVSKDTDPVWQVGGVSAYRFKLFGLIPFGTHIIRIERFDMNTVQSREHNEHVHVWDHKITLRDRGNETEYTDEVEIRAGWKTVFIWLWANAFYAHRQRRWIALLENKVYKR
jgi:hypothetical protein